MHTQCMPTTSIHRAQLPQICMGVHGLWQTPPSHRLGRRKGGFNPGFQFPAPQESQKYMHSMCTTVGREILPTASYDDMVQDLSPGIAAPTTLDVELLLALDTDSAHD